MSQPGKEQTVDDRTKAFMDSLAGKTFGERLEQDVQPENIEDSHQTRVKEIMDLAESMISDLFADQYGSAYVSVKNDGHLEIIPVSGRRFHNMLFHSYYSLNSHALTGEDINAVTRILEARVQMEGTRKQLNVRVARLNEAIYYDLTNSAWQAARMTADGWAIDNAPPPLFVRHSNQLPQVMPAVDGYESSVFDVFLSLFNIKADSQKLLLKCYIVALFFPEIPKPILMLHGEQGSAKSTMHELIKTLVDPCSVRTLSFPRDINELIQVLSHNYVANFDNVSHIQEWISDELCRAVTGSGFQKRALYTNDDDIIYSFKRCIGFNGINLAATKADLLDRGIIIQLERIPDDQRRKIQEVWAEFEATRPRLLACIFDIIVKVLRSRGTFSLPQHPRMADFAEVAELISRAMGYPDNTFLDAYFENIGLQTEQAIESSPVATAIMEFMETRVEWEGTVTELLAELEPVAEQLRIKTASAQQWPRAANALSRRLTEVTTNLRQVGISIERPVDKNKIRRVHIWKASPESPASPTALESFVDPEVRAGDDIPASNQTSPEIPPEKEGQRQVQNGHSGDMGRTGDNVQENQG